MGMFAELGDGGVDLLQGLGDLVSYRQVGAVAAFEVQAILDKSIVSTDPNGGYGQTVQTGIVTLHVLIADVPQPGRGDAISYDGENYTVDTYDDDGMGTWVMVLTEGEAEEI